MIKLQVEIDRSSPLIEQEFSNDQLAFKHDKVELANIIG